MQNISCDYQIVKGKSSKGTDFEALKFIIRTPLGNYETGLVFPHPMELAIIKKYTSNKNDGIAAIYSGDASPEAEGLL